ncbi:excinuclease ABC subunit UvrA [Treponema sp. R6D11]
MQEYIEIKGAREHNLKNVSLKIPKNKFVVITGVSGSGKSSLAFDTIYAEGRRRYIESLSAYARQFLGQIDKPDVDHISGLSPAISIDQKSTNNNPRSTVGTITEIYDYLRLLYARIGIQHCPNCGKKVHEQTLDQIVDNVLTLDEGTKIRLLAPVVRGEKGTHEKLIAELRKKGFSRVRINGEDKQLDDDITLTKTKKHSIEVIVDRLVIKKDITKRLTDSIETCLKNSDGLVLVDIIGDGEKLYSTNFACNDCGISLEKLDPRNFSFNNPFGACPVCSGLGEVVSIDENKIVKDWNLSLYEGAIGASGWSFGDVASSYFKGLAEHYNFDIRTPLKDLPREILDVIFYGSGDEKIKIDYERGKNKSVWHAKFEGVIKNLERRHRETNSSWMRADIESNMTHSHCHECGGKRLNKQALAVLINKKNIYEICQLSLADAKDFFDNIKLTKKEEHIARQILKEIRSRIKFLVDVGLSYLTLWRSSGSLSGGEAQRIRLATQIGAGLTGVLYVLDEPSIGLHQKDNDRLIATLRELTNLGNTLLVVEHDEDTMRASDFIVDVGVRAGIHGGNIVATGDINEIMLEEKSLTGQYLSGIKKIKTPKSRREGTGDFLEVIGAEENNLKKQNVKIPLGVLTCVTGVSGSGKSSLITEILYKELANKLNRASTTGGKHKEIKGLQHLDKVIEIDQSPIGRTPRSNPATYTGLFTDIRNIFAATNDAKTRGYTASRFSFNVRGGRCEACSGDGITKIEMHFLPDVYVPCEVCNGKRYNRETLEARYKGKNIYEVLEMTVEDALKFFENVPRIAKRLEVLNSVGLGYIKLGQSATTLSGGEAQRVKLATELSKRSTGRTIYILDEPTTGLHISDVKKLIKILNKLVDSGNSVVVIEHNLDVIKTADYIIDLGPDGGDGGGEIIATGTPEEVAENKKSYTGKYLKKHL